MSMQTLTIIQFISILAIYTGLTILLPAFVFHTKLRGERFCVRFLIYLSIGNFYLMNLVFLLQLMHISCGFTLFLGTVFPVAWAKARVHGTTLEEVFQNTSKAIVRFLGGTVGLRLLLNKNLRRTGKVLTVLFRRLLRSIRKNFFDWVGVVTVIGLVLWLFGMNLIRNFGYCASDIPVHNYWINAMSDNDIFVAGVYPFGFHCIIHYIHAVFGIPTYVLLRVFCLVQTLMVHLVLLAFLKACCRTKYMAYLGLLIYCFADVWNSSTYYRFYSSLPQEFGMMFILPSAYFLIAFFQDRQRENGAKGLKVHSSLYLALFAMCFGMTFSAHFYNTMIAGLFCLGIAVGYMGLLFRKAYLGRVLLAGLLSLLIAVLPMGIAVATGTPLEGSLQWGMSVIRGVENEPQEEEEETEEEDGEENRKDETEEEETKPSVERTLSSFRGGASDALPGGSIVSAVPGVFGVLSASGVLPEGGAASSEQEVSHMQPEDSAQAPEQEPREAGPVITFLTDLRNVVRTHLLVRPTMETVTAILGVMALLPLFGIVYLFFRKTRQYGSILISFSAFMVLMFIVLMSGWLGLPRLMDASRCSIYMAYMMAAALVFVADAAVSMIAGWIATKLLADIFSLAGIVLFAGVLIIGDFYKKPADVDALEPNDAIVCLTSILRENPKWTFTICSANDELRMVEEYGYHYETIDFLREMKGDRVKEYLRIPTPRVYFFIEKVPVDYTVPYAGSGRTVSKIGASQVLPKGNGLSIYQGSSRYTVMSKMYYWALAFQRLYPNEMKVYYETDEFICYVVEQNVYRLYDFSIDYGYNGYLILE